MTRRLVTFHHRSPSLYPALTYPNTNNMGMRANSNINGDKF